MRERKSSLLWSLETSGYGVDLTLAAGAATCIEVEDLECVPINEENVPRALVRSFMGNAELLQAARWKTMRFSVPISGSGALGTPPPWGKLVRCCAMGETITAGTKVEYKYVQSAEESGQGYSNYDGQLEKILGARGSFDWSFRARQRPMWTFNFIGLFVAIADDALPTSNLSAWQPCLPVNNTNTGVFSLHGHSPKMLEFTGQAGVETEYRNLVGMEQVDVADHAPSANVTFEPTTIAGKDYFSIVNSKATGALQLVHGPAQNRVQFDMGQTQLHTPQRPKQGKFRYNQFAVHPVATAAGNELTITSL